MHLLFLSKLTPIVDWQCNYSLRVGLAVLPTTVTHQFVRCSISTGKVGISAFKARSVSFSGKLPVIRKSATSGATPR